MKFSPDRPYSDPERRPQAPGDRQRRGGRTGWPHPHREDQRAVPVSGAATPAEYKAGLDLAIERGWLWLHESGTYVRFTQAGADLFA